MERIYHMNGLFLGLWFLWRKLSVALNFLCVVGILIDLFMLSLG
jgi:hypothetical protein